MHVAPPRLSLVFDKASNFDVTEHLAEDQRLVSRTTLRLKFSKGGMADRDVFPAWCGRRGHRPGRSGRAMAEVEIDTDHMREFEAAARKAFPVTSVQIMDQRMMVHTEGKPGRGSKWVELADFLKLRAS